MGIDSNGGDLFNDMAKKFLSIRLDILEICYQRGGHLASSFSCIEILGMLFEFFYQHNDNLTDTLRRDNFILSKGHAENAYYAFLSEYGYIDKIDLMNNYRAGSYYLGGHPSKNTNGIDVSTGALGHGIGIGCGFALAKKISNQKNSVYVLLGDTECTEGSVWEAAIFASAHELSNLYVMIDKNKISATDFTDNFTEVDDVETKFKAFGWNVICCEKGHRLKHVKAAFKHAQESQVSNKPKAIIFDTTKAFCAGKLSGAGDCHTAKITNELYEEIKSDLKMNYLQKVLE